MLWAHKITCKIETSILYPWEIGHYFIYQGQKYRIEKIISEVKYCDVNGVASEISGNTPIEHQKIASLVVGAIVK
jgi:hypothetical protein